MKINWFKYASPTAFYPVAGWLVPVFGAAALALVLFALYWGFFETPERLGGTNPQKEYYRIIFIHVPAAWMSMWLYLVLAAWSAVGLVFNTRLSFMMANAVAPTGAIFTFLALWTGAFWGRPSWGTYWDWDPRLTSELILLFLYLGYMSLRASFEDLSKADRASAVLALVGVVNLPIIHYSVIWWSSIHQGPTIKKLDNPSITWDMAWPLLTMILAFTLYAAAILLQRTRAEVLQRERHARWVTEVIGADAAGA